MLCSVAVVRQDRSKLFEVPHFRIADGFHVHSPLACVAFPHMLRCGEYGKFAHDVREDRRETPGCSTASAAVLCSSRRV